MYYENYIIIEIPIPDFEEIKKKYFDSDGNKLVPLNIEFQLKSPFEYFTPVMYSDGSGHMPKWLAWTLSGAAIVAGIALSATGVGGILGGILIGAGAGSLINGYVNEASGGSFDAGYIGGAISGALCGVGAGLGGLAFAAASEVTNAACIGYLAAGVGASFIGGFTGNVAGTLYTNWHDSGVKSINVNVNELMIQSAIMGGLNVFAGLAAGAGTVAGNMAKTVADVNSKIALRITAGMIAGGTEFAYDLTSYIISKLI